MVQACTIENMFCQQKVREHVLVRDKCNNPCNQREAQAAPTALVGTGPSAARWRLHHHWAEGPETGVSWNKIKFSGRLL